MAPVLLLLAAIAVTPLTPSTCISSVQSTIASDVQHPSLSTNTKKEEVEVLNGLDVEKTARVVENKDDQEGGKEIYVKRRGESLENVQTVEEIAADIDVRKRDNEVLVGNISKKMENEKLLKPMNGLYEKKEKLEENRDTQINGEYNAY